MPTMSYARWLVSNNLSHLSHIPKTGDFNRWDAMLICIVVIISATVFSYSRYRRAVDMISDFPGLRFIVSPMSALGLLLPALPFPLKTYAGFSFPWELKHDKLFKIFKCDTVSLCGWDGRALLYTCDVPFLTQICSYAARQVFPKPIEEYTVLSYFGDNLVVAEHDNWRRQRRVTAPAFSSKMFARLWIDMRHIVDEMFEQDKWAERTENFSPPYFNSVTTDASGEYIPTPGEIYFPHVVDITLRMALAAIARTGFGIDFTWRSDESFTQICSQFGEPQRWSWWLTILESVYDLYYDSSIPSHWEQIYAYLDDSIVFHTLLEDFSALWSLSMLLPLRVVWAVVVWMWGEIYSMIARPSEHDFHPKKMQVQEALHLVAKDSTLRLAVPSFIMNAPIRRMRRMRMAFNRLEEELGGLVKERKQWHTTHSQDSLACGSTTSSLSATSSQGSSHFSDISPSASRAMNDVEERSDLLHNLVKAAMLDKRSGMEGLSDAEIVGNTYIYFLAGHETTAHSLSWTLALLAAYPECQEKAYQEIMDNDPFGETTINDYPKFRYLLACYYETLRLFPPVQQIPKVVAEDMKVVVEASNEMEMVEQAEVPIQVQVQAATPLLNPREPSTPFSKKNNHRSLRLDIDPMVLSSFATIQTPKSSNLDTQGIAMSIPTTPTRSPPMSPGWLAPWQNRSLMEMISIPSTPSSYLSRQSSVSSLDSNDDQNQPPKIKFKPRTLPSKFDGPMPYQKVADKDKDIVVMENQTSFVAKKGTVVMVSPPAVHYNPKYWEDPEKFDPERFLKPYCHAAFIPFGVGHRACLGRKFSEVESVSMLVHLLRNYSVHLVPNGDTVEEARRKFSKASVRITLTPEKIPLVFRRRAV